MTGTQYGIRKSERAFPSIDMGPIPHMGKPLIVAIFGPNNYRINRERMRGKFSHRSELGDFSEITFKPATTSESISAATYKFNEMAKPQIFDSSWLQTGYRSGTEEGVFLNPLDEQRNPIQDGNILKRMLNGVEKVNGIYLINDFMAFAPHDSFEQGIQESGKFAESGLACALEHTTKKSAPNLKKISSKKNYKLDVEVSDFNTLGLTVASLLSLRDADGGRLLVYGGYWYYNNGSAFGVFNSGEASAKKSRRIK